MLTLEEMAAFAQVAHTGSFSTAARKMNLSQPAVSRRVARLEQALGAALLTRTSACVRLTAEGRDLLPSIQELLAGHDRLVAQGRQSACSSRPTPACPSSPDRT